MARRYRMTPARRAALRKAQLASARKRKRAKIKRRVVRSVAGVGAVTGVATASVYGHKLKGRTRPEQVAGKTYPSSRALGAARVRGNPQNAHITIPHKKGAKWTFEKRTKGVFKVPGQTTFEYRAPRHIKRNRPDYDRSRRG